MDIDERVKQLETQLAVVQSQVSEVKTTVGFLNPASLIQFKGKVLEALQYLDSDIKKVQLGVSDIYSEITKIKVETSKIAVKSGVTWGIGTGLVMSIFSILISKLF